MGDEFWGKKGEEIAGKGGCEDGVEGAEDGERGVAEEGEKEMGLELGGKTGEMVEEGGEGEEGGEREIGLERRRRGGTAGGCRGPDTIRRGRSMGRREGRRGGGSVGGAARFFSCGIDGGVVGEGAFAAKALDSIGESNEGGTGREVFALEHAPARAGSEVEVLVHLGAMGVAIAKGGAVATGEDEGEGAEGGGQLCMEEGIVGGVVGEDGGRERGKGDGLVGGGGGGGSGDTAERSAEPQNNKRHTWLC